MRTEYDIVQSTSIDMLAEEVEGLLAHGWSLAGPLVIDHPRSTHFLQPMMRKMGGRFEIGQVVMVPLDGAEDCRLYEVAGIESFKGTFRLRPLYPQASPDCRSLEELVVDQSNMIHVDADR